MLTDARFHLDLMADYAKAFVESQYGDDGELIAAAHQRVETYFELTKWELESAPEALLIGLLIGLSSQLTRLEDGDWLEQMRGIFMVTQITVIYWTMQAKGWT